MCQSQLIKKLNSTEWGALFRHFCVSKKITTAHAHKSGVIFHFFPRALKQIKKKALQPKMTKIASRWSCLKPLCARFLFFSSCNVRMRCVSYHTNFLQAIPCINPNFDHLLYFFYLSNACLFYIFLNCCCRNGNSSINQNVDLSVNGKHSHIWL